MNKFIKNKILKSFFKIKLTGNENTVALDSINLKYSPSLKIGLFYGIISLPSILLLDITIITSVLIPITLVSGTAWFSISLASMKKKFEFFGLELTENILKAFITSLILLIIISGVSLFSPFLGDIIEYGKKNNLIMFLSSLLGFYVIIQIIYNILIGSLKYDINDAMLSGQNESAEKFYKKSLSLLQITSENLRKGNKLEVSNYYIGVSFYEIFTYTFISIQDKNIKKYITESNKLINEPSMDQKHADKISIYLITNFLKFLDKESNDIEKSISSIEDELYNLTKKNNPESQEMADVRISVVLEEIGNMIEDFGENLFIKK